MLTRYLDGSYIVGEGSFSELVVWAPQFTSAETLVPPNAGILLASSHAYHRHACW